MKKPLAHNKDLAHLPAALVMSGPTTLSRTAPHDGRKYRMLKVLDEFSYECLAIPCRSQAQGDHCP